ncbi:hypothetical protein CHCC19466_0041 [Bacillus licheniformis]|nr:hypothetical protein CHCC19466_0041 [Bacillus licheniformis]TWM05881.1 hypothetical protein CHCC15289_1778 [Bacillus licheniformis]
MADVDSRFGDAGAAFRTECGISRGLERFPSRFNFCTLYGHLLRLLQRLDFVLKRLYACVLFRYLFR